MTQPSRIDSGSFKVAMSHVLPAEHARSLPPLNDATRSANEDAARTNSAHHAGVGQLCDSGVACVAWVSVKGRRGRGG